MKNALIVLIAAGLILSCKNSKDQKNEMPDAKLFIDVHHLGEGNVTAEDVAAAHLKDLKTQNKYNVKFLKYWVDEQSGHVYCLSKAPDKKSISDTHGEAHGLIPHEIHTVVPGKEAAMKGNTKLFLDVHELGKGNVTAKAVADAHEKDLQVQDKYHVNFLNYWVDESEGVVYCLAETDSADNLIKAHKEAHGLIPSSVMEVIQGE